MVAAINNPATNANFMIVRYVTECRQMRYGLFSKLCVMSKDGKWTAVTFVMRKGAWKTEINVLWNVNGVWFCRRAIVQPVYESVVTMSGRTAKPSKGERVKVHFLVE